MPQVIGTESTDDYHRGHEPWSEQKRAKPLKTWSGEVVYKRRKHVWHIKDAERIAKNVEIDIDDSEPDWLRLFIERIKQLAISLLGKVLPFLGGDQVAWVYEIVEDFLLETFKIDTTFMDTPPPSVNRIIEYLALKWNLTITVKKN